MIQGLSQDTADIVFVGFLDGAGNGFLRRGVREAWLAELSKVRETARRSVASLAADREGDRTHTEVQAWLRDLGRALGYEVWVAANDRGRIHNGGQLGAECLDSLPASIENAPSADSIRLIDIDR